MEERIGHANLRDVAIAIAIKVDKMLALTGQMSSVNIANIWIPSEEEREEHRRKNAALDAIARRLQQPFERPEPGPG